MPWLRTLARSRNKLSRKSMAGSLMGPAQRRALALITAAVLGFAPPLFAQWSCPDRVEVLIDCESCTVPGYYWGTAENMYFAAGPPPTYYYQGAFYDGMNAHYHFSFLIDYEDCPMAWEGDFTPRSLFVWPY